MQDLCGREWTAQEYEMISNDRRLDKEELEVIKGLEKRSCIEITHLVAVF